MGKEKEIYIDKFGNEFFMNNKKEICEIKLEKELHWNEILFNYELIIC